VTLKLGVLVSGSGSNFQAIADAISSGELDAECRLVLSNRADAFALERARKAGLPSAVLNHKDFANREDFDARLVALLKEADVEWIVLAGFMRVLTSTFLDAFRGRIVNIHPSLLPSFPGVNAQKQAFEHGVKVTGCTVHFVDSGVDSGPIIAQQAVNVLEDDTLETLRARILEQEHRVFVEALKKIAAGQISEKDLGRRSANSRAQ
jgi:phosphoribosylglycinamide formyltransferase-1